MANTPGGGALILGVADDARLIGTNLAAEWLRHRIYELTDHHLTVDAYEVTVAGVRLVVLRMVEAVEPIRYGNKIRWRVDDHCVEVDAATWHDRRLHRIGFDWSALASSHPMSDVGATVPPAPTAVNDSSSGAFGATQLIHPISNDTAAAGVSLDATSLRFCTAGDSAPHCTRTSATVDGKGTFTVDTSNATVTFRPADGFSGSVSPVAYGVTDQFGQATSATIAVTVTARDAPPPPPPAAPPAAPGAPTNVSATPGDHSATVSWQPPVSDSGAPITGYTVTAHDSTGAAVGSCTTSGALTCAISGLTNKAAYTFTVVATNGAGGGPASVKTAPATPTLGRGLPVTGRSFDGLLWLALASLILGVACLRLARRPITAVWRP